MSRLIYTIDSRNCVFLETIKAYFHISDEDMHLHINLLHDALLAQLREKGIDYNSLKSALIPNKEGKELILICDSSQIEGNVYDHIIFNEVLKAFDYTSINSILHGDYIDTINDHTSQEWLYNILSDRVDISHVQYEYSSQFFLIYIQNVNATLEHRLHQVLQGQDWFVGIADVTYASKFKAYISAILTFNIIKYKDTIIQSTPDYEQSSDTNQFFYDFEGLRFKIKNIQEELFFTFLDYKIERPYISQYDLSDQHLSLNAITPIFKQLQDCEINVPESKITYLKTKKGGTLHNIGLDNISAKEFREIIKDRINSSYIYSMKYEDAFDTLLFNIMLEFTHNAKCYKVLLGLKYIKETHTIQPVTMF